MRKINEQVISTITDLVGGLLNANTAELDEAYLRAEGSLAVSIGVKISPDDKGLKIQAGLSFVSGRIKDTATAIIDNEQIALFHPEYQKEPEEPNIFGSLAPSDLEGEEGDPLADEEAAVLEKLEQI